MKEDLDSFETKALNGLEKHNNHNLQIISKDCREISKKPSHTACTDFQTAKRLAASNLPFQVFEGFVGT